MSALPPFRRVRFSEFEVDLRAREIRKHGRKIKLQDQPFRLLATLLERPGDVITRDELRQKLWPADTFVDFDVGLNTAVKRLRDALGDTAEGPRFVETLPRRGYRFIARTENCDQEERIGQSHSLPARADLMTERELYAHVDGRTQQRFLEAVEDPASRGRAVLHAPGRFWVMFVAVVGLVCFSAVVGLNRDMLRGRLLGRAVPPQIQSVTVLPFDNLTGDPTQDYIVEGMTDALTTELAQIKELRVISRTSALRYQEARKPLPQIGRELNVEAVVAGTLQRVGDRVWITAQLIEVATDRHLWAKRYERSLQELASLPNQLANDLILELKPPLTAEEQGRMARPQPPTNPEAHEAYLLGRFFWTKRDAQSATKSVEYYKQALTYDSNYAAAYAGLAESYEMLAFGLAASEAVGRPATEAALKGRVAAMKALELDDHLAEAHAALGHLYMSTGDKGAEPELRRALELNPSCADANHWLAQLLSGAGRQKEALVAIQRAHEMDPLSPNILKTKGAILTRQGKYDDATEAFRKAVALAPNQTNVRFSLAQHYEMRGMYPEALAEYQKVSELMNNDPKSRLMVAYAYAVMGQKRQAESTFQELKGRATRDKTAYWCALVTHALGREDEALRWLERARLEDALQGLPIDNFRFGTLRVDPRYQSWRRRANAGTN